MRKQCPQCARCMAFPEKEVCSICEWDNETASNKSGLSFISVDTVSLVSRKNVSKKRLEMMKSRILHPDGSGEVVFKDHRGKPTSRLASDHY